mgnify:CR=1 FL=1
MSAKANATPIFKWRIIVVTALLAGLFGMLVLRLVQLQVGASQYGADFLPVSYTHLTLPTT